jgi:hypothetical protein
MDCIWLGEDVWFIGHPQIHHLAIFFLKKSARTAKKWPGMAEYETRSDNY